ncbi:mitochondrial porin family protein [Sphingobacterium yanglingense]|uniref:Uncharacterized protein n=1 Tax=Sphingobacterium yanglingense TaxID=1437280 RepID=A0A4V3DCT6_9SPHI|nr:hypothetical protein [Sphingobacterium yanglingense]TDQ73403.1 hypothetical protein CLV99_4455 [Sphingobacterium yanglingense]
MFPRFRLPYTCSPEWLMVLLLICFTSLSGFAQEDKPIQWGITTSMSLQAGVNSLEVELQNNSATAFEGYVTLELPSDLVSLSTARIAVRIAPGKKRFLSLKLRAQALGALKGKSFNVLLHEQAGTQIALKKVQLEVADKRSVQLQDNSSVQYLRNIGDSIEMLLRVINTGTTDEAVKILLSSPDRVGKVVFQQLDVSIRSGQDTLLRHTFPVERYMMTLSQYTVRVAGIYDNNDVFGNLSVLYANITSSRNFQQMFAPDRSFSGYTPNYVEFRVSNILDEQQSYNLFSEGAYRLMGGRIRYGAAINRWGGDARWNVNNTFLEYEKRGHSVAVGNIQESLEAPFYGRGGTYAYRDTALDQRVSFGVLQRTPNLLGGYGNDNPGFTAFARLQLAEERTDGKRYEGQVIYDNNRMDSVSAILWTNRFDILRSADPESVRLEGFLGAGVQQYHGIYYKEQSMPSFAAGVKMNKRARGWDLSSDNYYSSGYFPGNRRGTIQLVQRVNRRLKQLGVGLGYSYIDYSPLHLNPYFQSFKSGTSKWDMQLSLPLSSRGQLSIVPSYSNEYADYMLQQDIVKLSARYALLLASANLRSKDLKHSLFLTVEGGGTSLKGLSSTRFVVRTDFSYNYERLGIFGNYQSGAFQIYDMMSSQLMGQEIGKRYLLGARYQGDLLQRRINWTGSVSGQVNQGWGHSFNSNLQGQYRIAKLTQLQAVFQYIYNVGVTNYKYDYTNLQIGVRQQFKGQDLDRPAIKTGDMQVFCYYDNNGNSVFDAGDEKAVDYEFTVRNILFVTDKKGEATFKKMSYGSYMLFFPLKNQYQGSSRVVEIDRKTTRLEVALHKVGVVKGQLLLDYDPALSLATNTRLDIYHIIARSPEGKEFTIKADVHGRFEFHLPEGEYTISPDANHFPENVYMNQSAYTITVVVGKELELKSFQLLVKGKKVDIKRFGQKN